MKLRTSITVLAGNIVSVDPPKEMLTNVPFPTKGYSFPVKISNTHGNKFSALGNGKGSVYDCRVDPPLVGYAKPWSDLDSGKTFCLFFPYSPEHLVETMPRTADVKQHISISVHATLKEGNHASGSASALFIGGFSLLDSGKLNLTPDLNKTIVTIMGNTGVEFYWQERNSLLISPIHKEDFGIGSRALYEVKVLGNAKFTDKITIRLPANGQKVEIDVTYDPKTKRAWKISFDFTLLASALVCVAVLILTVVIFIRALDRPERSQLSIATHAPSSTAHATPDRGSPVVAGGNHSPRTPQPFMEYVRRTIDETPYYRRDGQRRFNPQNTY